MSDDPLLPSKVCTALMRLGTRMATLFDQKFAGAGMTQAQFRVLLAVWDAGDKGIAPSVLADHLLIERATVSVLTNKMVERGWLLRQPGENRRTFRLADETLREVSPGALRQMEATLETVEARLRAWATREE